MQKIIENSKCCGCHACMNICPKGAINMHENYDGFKYPIIDNEKCINCGMCKKVCPVLNSKENKKEIKAYACYNKNLNERLKSSSGGIFILLAKEIIRRKGVVFGACFNSHFDVIHSYAENEKDLEKFMGSKYVQSDIGNTYKLVKKYLENDRYVLFTGTPCQVEGLKSFLKKDYEKLYTQDIICHGVPSPKVWKKYLEYQKRINKGDIKEVLFRNKDNGWTKFQIKIRFKSATYNEVHSNDLFMRAFLNNICLRESCYNCSFKKKYRNSDITLADYWGIDKVHPGFNDDKGVSLVVVNSSKGKELFESIQDNINYICTNLDQAILYNSSMIKSVSYVKNRSKFSNYLDNMEFDKLIRKYVQPSFLKKILGKMKNMLKKIM